MSFPTTLPSYTITSGNDTLNTTGGFGLSPTLNSIEADVVALGTKIGTGASTSVSGAYLAGNGTGTSSWATLTEAVFATSDITTNDVSTSKHGFVPKAPNDITKFLRGDASWSLPPYFFPITPTMTVVGPLDATTYYASGIATQTNNANQARLYTPVVGIITAVYLWVLTSSTVGTTETSSVYIRLNDTTDTLITSGVVTSTNTTVYNNTGLNISISVGDFVCLKWTTPTWVTNPGQVVMAGMVRIN